MAVTIEEVKRLKDLTGVGLTDAKHALEEAGGDFDKALDEMRKKGLTKADKRAEREASEGVVVTYNHDSRIGVVVELNCETSFVAKTDEFKQLGQDIAMHIVASNPEFISSENIPQEVRDEKAAEFKEKVVSEGKPADIADNIVEGMLKKYFAERCLLDQPFVKDQDKDVAMLIKEHIAKLGENIVVRKMARVELGQRNG
ncbi:MAG: elongation factor Ts [Patescibacteria group bacterium]|nr:elongation factor Ts [Patescibacteria group bacterium]